MIVNSVYLVIALGAYAAYRLACWVHDRAEHATDHEVRRHDA
ncbi:hypothetical protein [Microbacterium sp. XT11]|nr:hypothetical protein [Microbacterium sp. XT11]